jgi:tetratricopeptide (TPR) repeat protein
MPGRIEQTAERAHQLVETGEVVAARAMLREALAAVEPDPRHASPSLATSAMLYARVLVTLGEPGTARRWAAYAHTASRRLYGAGDARTLQAASVLAGALYRAGAYSRAAHLYRKLINQLPEVDGVEGAQALAAQADLATVLHARGDCAQARGLLEETWRAYRHGYGEDHPLGLKMLARLGVMERNCGLSEPARQRFALAEALCRRHLPPGHRLTAQIGILSRTPPDRRHTCSEPLAPYGDREGVAPEGALPPGTDAPPPSPSPRSCSYSPRNSRIYRFFPGAQVQDRGDGGGAGRLRLVAVAGLAAMIVTVIVVAAGGLIARAGSTSDGSRAAASATPGNPVPSTAAAGAAVPSNPAAAPVPGDPASAAVPGDPAGPSNPAGAPTPLPSEPPVTRPAAAPAPPTAVTLTDTRTAITLAWVYPEGADGPVVLSAGRPGQSRRTFQTLPAGTTRFTVYGLAADTNFCFGVGVTYSATTVKTAPAVCTHR